MSKQQHAKQRVRDASGIAALQRHLTLTSAVTAYKKYRAKEAAALKAINASLKESKAALQEWFLLRPMYEYETNEGTVSATITKMKVTKKIEREQGVLVLRNVLQANKNKALTPQQIQAIVHDAERSMDGDDSNSSAAGNGRGAGADSAATEPVVKIVCKPTPEGVRAFDFARAEPVRLLTWLAQHEWQAANDVSNAAVMRQMYSGKVQQVRTPARVKGGGVVGHHHEEDEEEEGSSEGGSDEDDDDEGEDLDELEDEDLAELDASEDDPTTSDEEFVKEDDQEDGESNDEEDEDEEEEQPGHPEQVTFPGRARK